MSKNWERKAFDVLLWPKRMMQVFFHTHNNLLNPDLNHICMYVMTLGEWKMLGLITFLDPPRPDTKKTIEDARYRCGSSCY